MIQKTSQLLFIPLIILTLSGCESLLPNNRNLAEDVVRGIGYCNIAKLAKTELSHQRLYTGNSENCHKADLFGDEKNAYFTDAECTVEVDFSPSKYVDFCKETFTPYHDRLGNAAIWAGRTQKWTLYPPVQFDVGVLSIKNNAAPFMKRVKYKSVPTRVTYPITNDDGSAQEVTALRGHGVCHLEMRIFKEQIDGNNLKPLLLIHGGAWRSRVDFLGLESQVSHYTSRGFVVFAPFYRLVANRGSNLECNGASWNDVVADIEDALIWVKDNADEYGASDGKPRVMGHSAGGHLTSWLLTYFPQDIEKAVVNYGATDFRHYIKQAQASEKTLIGEHFIEDYLKQEDLDSISPDHEDVMANSFVYRIAENHTAYPPTYIIHGMKDNLVPPDQSVRLCNAFNGNISNGPAIEDGGDSKQTFRKVYQCNDNSRLYLLSDADHGLDICLQERYACSSGKDPLAQKAAQQTISETADWLAQ